MPDKNTNHIYEAGGADQFLNFGKTLVTTTISLRKGQFKND